MSDQEVPRPSDAPSAPKSPPPGVSVVRRSTRRAPGVSMVRRSYRRRATSVSMVRGSARRPAAAPGRGPTVFERTPRRIRTAAAPAAAPLPWEAREQYGFLKALADTALLFTQKPRAAFERAKTKGDYASPLLWVLIFGIFGAAMQWLWSVMFLQTWLTMLPPT